LENAELATEREQKTNFYRHTVWDKKRLLSFGRLRFLGVMRIKASKSQLYCDAWILTDLSLSGGQSLPAMPNSSERLRLEGLYEKLQLKLLDLSRRNGMLSYSLGTRSQRHIRIVDNTLEDAYAKLVGEETKLRIAFLPEPDDLLPEEKTDDFMAALEHAKVSDIDYLSKLDILGHRLINRIQILAAASLTSAR
jgi:hypothetical protein